MNLLNLTTIFSIGLLTGTEFTVSAFINPVLRQLEDSAQAAAIRLFARRLGKAMPFWYGASLLLLITATLRSLHQPGGLLFGIASSIWAAVILLTVMFLVPINNRVARMDTSSFAKSFRQLHRKWDALHRVRVAALAACMIIFLAGVHG